MPSGVYERKPKIRKVCPCGNEFFVTKGQDRPGHAKYCSRECYNTHPHYRPMLKGKKRHPFSEEWKQNISKARKESGASKGSNNPNWKGGITKLQVKIRNLEQYKVWRLAVYNRDNFTCVKCGIEGNGSNLNADHIDPLSIIIRKNEILTIDDAISCDEIWSVANGRTLCISCHRETDTYGWKLWNDKLNNGGLK